MIRKIFGESVGVYTLPNAELYNDEFIKFAYYSKNLVNNTDIFKLMKESNAPQDMEDHIEPFIHRSHLIPGYPLKFLDDVMWVIQEYTKEMGQEFNQHNFPYLAPYVSRAWTNITSQGDYIGSHDHKRFDAKFSISYYPKFLPEQGDLHIENTDLKVNKRIYPCNEVPARERIEGKKGQAVIFPGYIKHHTEINKSLEDRISTSCDIKYLGINSDLPPPELVNELTSAFQQELTTNFKL